MITCIVSESEPVSITSPGTAVTGEIYTLECFALNQPNTEAHPVITWLNPMNNTIPSASGRISESTFGSMSTLTFSPLRASDNGTYTCTTAMGSALVRITVKGELNDALKACRHKNNPLSLCMQTQISLSVLHPAVRILQWQDQCTPSPVLSLELRGSLMLW